MIKLHKHSRLALLCYCLVVHYFIHQHIHDAQSRCGWRRLKLSPHDLQGGGKGSGVGEHHGEGGARAYKGGRGSEPPAGSRGRAPGQGVRGAKTPWSWKHFGHWMSNGAGKFSTSSWKQYALLRSTGVRVGGPRVHGAPNHWPLPPPMGLAHTFLTFYDVSATLC